MAVISAHHALHFIALAHRAQETTENLTRDRMTVARGATKFRALNLFAAMHFSGSPKFIFRLCVYKTNARELFRM